MAKPDVQTLVRNIRHKAGWTQECLAREIGVSYSKGNIRERGKRSPKPFLLWRLREIESGLASTMGESNLSDLPGAANG